MTKENTMATSIGDPRGAGFDLVGSIIAYEEGELADDGIIELFAHLVRTGQAWMLQGHYGRTAAALIEGGRLDGKGAIL